MDNAATREKIFQIIRTVFAQPNLAVTNNTTAADVADWDSFNHMNLIMQVEEEFGVTFDTEEIGKMGRVGELVEAVCRKQAALA